MNLLVDLKDIRSENAAIVGAKAANLARLLHAGFPVPPGAVLTTGAFELFLSFNGLSLASTLEIVASSAVPSEIVRVLLTVPRLLGDVPMAVRSSAVSEDLIGASFAGQYETVLGVRSTDEMVSAVRRCWASNFADRVAGYRSRYHEDVGKMAVLIQCLVQPDAAGVAFTANPVTGDRSQILVSAVRGLGERLVSGQASPDEWLVEQQTATRRSGHENAIDGNRAVEVANLARRVEAHFGTPQDMEWAVADGQVFVLQARPITTALRGEVSSSVKRIDVPIGFWEREASHYPRPLSPMFRSIFIPIVNAALGRLFDESGLLIKNLEHREIGGWVYLRKVPLGGKDRPPPPQWLLWVLTRVIPRLRARVKHCIEAVRSDKFGAYVQRWNQEWRPGLKARLHDLRKVDVTQLSDVELKMHISSVVVLFRESMQIHQLLAGTLALVLADFAFTCRSLLGWSERQALNLVSGLSDSATDQSRGLAELARLAKDRPPVRTLLERQVNVSAKMLRSVDAEFANAFTAYQYEFGDRSPGYELIDATPAETPELTARLIRDQLVRAYSAEARAAVLERRRSSVSEARALLSQRPLIDRDQFERVLRRAEETYPLREDNGLFTVSMPLALLRYAFLEVGDRLLKRGLVDEPQDIFFLESDEAVVALEQSIPRQELISQRMNERAWALGHPAPASYGKNPGPPPVFTALPSEARFAMEAMVWAVQNITAPDHGSRQGIHSTTLHGIPASGGQYAGPVRVILTEAEIYKVRPGDVVVCPITSPAWAVLFPVIGALITDSGGILSHPAILAREFGIPAIVNTGDATSRLKDDQLVAVDGNNGTIEIKG